MGGTAARLAAEGIEVHFGGLTVIANVSLALGKGEILGLIGPNGAGKTTFVNVLSGFQRPNAGKVRLGEEDVTAWEPARRARAGLVRTFQAVRLFHGLTVLENVEVAALAQGLPRPEARRRAMGTLEFLELAPHAASVAASLPYGLERRVGIARALVMSPDFVLLDEPAAGLNEVEGDELLASIRAIRDERDCGILLIEHNMRIVFGLCDRVHVLRSGTTIADGTPEEVRGQREVRDAYLGEEER